MNDFIKNITVSWARNVNVSVPAGNAPLLKMMQSVKLKDQVKQMLSMPTGTEAEMKAQKAFKTAHFPVLVPGVFAGSFCNEAITEDARCMIVDCDAQDNPGLSVERMFEILMPLPYVAAISDSIRGAGVYAVIRINPTRSNEDFHLIAESLEYELGELGLNIDLSCKNISRKRFFGYHTRQYFRETEPDIYLPQWKIPVRKTFKNALQAMPDGPAKPNNIRLADMRTLDDLVKEVQDRKLDIAPDYSDYLALAFALGDTMGEDGRAAYHGLCQHSAKYDYADADSKYSNAISSSKGVHTMATAYDLLKRAGVVVTDCRKIEAKNKALRNIYVPVVPTIQRKQYDYPASWDRPHGTGDAAYNHYRLINALENLEHAVLMQNDSAVQRHCETIECIGLGSIPAGLFEQRAPRAYCLLTQKN